MNDKFNVIGKFESSVEKMGLKQKTDFVTWALFLTTLVVILISLTSAIFPVFITSSFGDYENLIGIDIFETGIWTFPLLATTSIILVLGVLYKKKVAS